MPVAVVTATAALNTSDTSSTKPIASITPNDSRRFSTV